MPGLRAALWSPASVEISCPRGGRVAFRVHPTKTKQGTRIAPVSLPQIAR